MKTTIPRLTLVYSPRSASKLCFSAVSLIFLWLSFTGQSYARIDIETAVGIWFFDEGKGEIAKDSSLTAMMESLWVSQNGVTKLSGNMVQTNTMLCWVCQRILKEIGNTGLLSVVPKGTS